jgi:hypothetical protein
VKQPARFVVRCALLLIIAAAVAFAAHAQRSRNHGQVHSMQASSDHGAMHADKFTINTPVKITCMNATSEVANSQPVPACRLTATGFNGVLAISSAIDLKAPGDITLTCIGQGGFLRCSARVDIPPPTQ